MGGCKCTFRSCPVSSQKLPKMTFFHYPLKKDHLEKWIEYADFDQINTMAPSQAKNKSVCALHFKDECFMNYKKNRLTKWAIPTLDRLTTGEVFDYSLDTELKPITLPPTKDKHLIPPPGENIWGQPPEFWKSYSTVTFKHLDNTKTIRDVELFATEPLAKKPRILNNDLLTVCSTNGSLKIDDTDISFTGNTSPQENFEPDEDDLVSDIDLQLVEEESTNHVDGNQSTLEVSSSDDIIHVDEELDFITEVQADPVEELISRAAFDATCSTYESEIQALKADLESREIESEQTITKLKVEMMKTKKKLQLSEDATATWKLKIKECEKKLVDLEAKCQELIKAKASQPIPVDIKPTITLPSSTPLTKPQLFNGIKKYLSASMTALVRMEMFGNSERAWKPDEKQACVELFKLGETVFKYLRDEWRFRLPPKKMVEEWTNEVTHEDEDDL